MKKRPFSANFGWKARPSRPSSTSVSTFTLNSGPEVPSATDAHFAAPPFSSTTHSADSPGGNCTSVGESNPRATGRGGEDDRRDQRLEVHLARLLPERAHLQRVGDLLLPRVHVAQTARREVHSGLLSPLEVAHPGGEEREEQPQAREPGRAPHHQ